MGRSRVIFFPAIDIKNGKCIRLEKGSLEKLKVYNHNPIDQALEFEKMGCEWIHIVDIDGAFNGTPFNHDVIFEIKKKCSCKIQVGGGIRNIETVEKFFKNSIDRIIIGTAAIKDPNFVKIACENFPKKIAIGIDTKQKMVASEGWSETSSLSSKDLIKRMQHFGVSVFIFTDIDRDGLLKGMNFEEIIDVLKSTNTKIIASGGVTTLQDLKNLKKLNYKNLDGVISGKAIYERRFKVEDAIRILK
ncbi:MAG: 1-(5-phosphoribosyl)-5-[(5-phosphoribosylamino)methylideneamino]imidazole-4-carboxamide isomerase [Rickettsiales bacterium TMED254]|nr:1-(5-phosphoribosyl)-5-[(5-phosphoribosylamino)methylideneamino]imidazole-4-carboxamide isomerase [Rickettsiales bacterium]RPF76262.1 MAG: 1-(5-phosphoribosyl)-5-[(5-phosphoribosylamino)methylideneamino]imidazole-4-carboxamide isomerase [Rickettsiales bacterium TMED254]